MIMTTTIITNSLVCGLVRNKKIEFHKTRTE
ncbi:hypothetical protein ACTG5T_07565 [Pasteurella multocida]